MRSVLRPSRLISPNTISITGQVWSKPYAVKLLQGEQHAHGDQRDGSADGADHRSAHYRLMADLLAGIAARETAPQQIRARRRSAAPASSAPRVRSPAGPACAAAAARPAAISAMPATGTCSLLPRRFDDAGVFVHRFAGPALARRVVRLERHVEPPGHHQHHENRLQPVGGIGVGDAHQHAPDHGVHQALGILAVVDGADARNHAQEKGQAGETSECT